MSVDDLFAEAERQLSVCNSCRYCEGYCPVWPTLETPGELTSGKLLHLANLCHDCGDCLTACMYSAPHEFALNPPALFSAVRRETYRDYAWPPRPGWARGPRGIAALVVALAAAVAALVLALAALLHDPATASAESPYRLIPHWVLVAVAAAPAAWGCAVAAVAAGRYWRDAHGPLRALARPVTWLLALADGVRLRYLRGGGAQCAYPAEEPSGRRRAYHMWLVGGLFLCLLSTAAAFFQEELAGWPPPYPFFSAPPLLGTLGGIAMIAGSAGLLAGKRESSPERGAPGMRRADYLLLSALLTLAVTGLLTLGLRATPLLPAILVIHLVCVLTCFAVAPYTKFMHFVYRLLSIYKYRLDAPGEDA